MFDNFMNTWRLNINSHVSVSGKGGNKLRTYNIFKKEYNTEHYCKIVMPYSHRSAFSKFRCGVAPIRLETGRFEHLNVEDRVCFHCKNSDIEDEFHVILKCPLYHDIRVPLFTEALKTEAELTVRN